MSLPLQIINNMSCQLFLACLSILVISAAGDKCLAPKYESKVYTTSDSTASEMTVFVVEFVVSCKNNVQDLNLYAEINGQTIPASKVPGTLKYQVSMSGEHKTLSSGAYPMRVFDEEGYGDLRKAQRSGDDASAVKSLFDITINHQGASQGFLVNSSMVAALASLSVVYIAYNSKLSLS